MRGNWVENEGIRKVGRAIIFRRRKHQRRRATACFARTLGVPLLGDRGGGGGRFAVKQSHVFPGDKQIEVKLFHYT